MPVNSIVIDYDVEAFPFQAILARDVFKVRRIDQLHSCWKRQTGKSRLTYADNLRLRKLMQRIGDDALFYKIYHLWIRQVLAPHYGGRISYSAHPKMRVHLADTGCVSDFHCDADVTGRDEQINCYLPFTDVYDTSTVWARHDYDSDDYQPLNLSYGQALIWDGGRLRHGTFYNETSVTRVSCDFRFHALDGSRINSPWCDVLAGRPPDRPG